MWKKLITTGLIAILTACQPKMLPWGPDASTVTVRQGVRLSAALSMPAALKTQAIAGDIHHLTLKLYDPADLTTAVATTTVLPPFGAMITGIFRGLASGDYKLTVEAFATADDSYSITEGGPLTSTNVATVSNGNVTYDVGTAFAFATPLQLIHGGTWRTTLSGTYSGLYHLSLVNRATKAVIGGIHSTLGTISVGRLQDGTYDIWGATTSATQQGTASKPLGTVVVADDGLTVTGPAALTMTSPVLRTFGRTGRYQNLNAFSGSVSPGATAVDTLGNVYYADFAVLSRIGKIDTAGRMTIIAGNGAVAFSDGLGDPDNASFSNPRGIAVDATGNVYVADTNNHRIRKLSWNGSTYTVSTIAGTGSTTPFTDGAGDPAQATFRSPQGIAVDATGNVYVADSSNHRIRKLSWNGSTYTVSTIAGTGTSSPFTDGAGDPAQATFNSPQGIAVDAAGHVYVSDTTNHRIRKLSWNGTTYTVSTIAGTGNSSPFTDGAGNPTVATFSSPQGLAVDASGHVYVADRLNHRIRKLSWNGATYTVSTIAGTGNSTSFTDGGGDPALATFNSPQGIAVDTAGNLYVADGSNLRMRKLSWNGTAYTVSTIAGNGSQRLANGDIDMALFNSPRRITVDAAGHVYVVDSLNHRIRKLSWNGSTYTVSTIAGTGNSSPFTDGGGDPALATFNTPQGIAVDATGNLYVADASNHRIRKLSWNGSTYTVSTIAGTGTSGSSDGGGDPALATFNSPQGIAVDAAGNLYVADGANQRVRKLSWNGSTYTVSTVASGIGVLSGIAVDVAGHVYVTDRSNHRIRKLSWDGTTYTASVIAGVGQGGSNGGGDPALASFNTPMDIAVDAAGNLYVLELSSPRIRKLSWNGSVYKISTIAGTGSSGSGDGGGDPTLAAFASPQGIAVDASGFLYVADSVNHLIRKIE